MEEINKPQANDIEFVISELEKIISDKKEALLQYMKECMSQEEIDRHGDNIFIEGVMNKGDLAKVQINLLLRNNKIKSDCNFNGDKNTECYKVLGRCVICDHYVK